MFMCFISNMSLIFKVRKRLKRIREFTETNRFVISYSGGKDSTVLLHLVLEEIIEHRDIEIVLVYADTLVENPLMHNYVLKTLSSIEHFASCENLKIEIVTTKPNIQSTFWINLIGKGYPLPHRKFRWCQDKLKIKPVKQALKKYYGKGVMLVASRMDESNERKNSLKRRIGENFEVERNALRVFAPMYDILEDEIWKFLTSHTPPYGGSYAELFKLYEEAGRLGKVRFGCWVCSLIRRDKALENQSKIYPYFKHFYEFRNFLINFTENINSRYPFGRKGQPAKNNKGALTLQCRKEILSKLHQLEFVLGKKIISSEEENLIKKIWNFDKEKIKFLLEQYKCKIY